MCDAEPHLLVVEGLGLSIFNSLLGASGSDITESYNSFWGGGEELAL